MKTKVTHEKKKRGREKREESQDENTIDAKPHALTHAPYYRMEKLKDRSICSLQE